MEESDRRTIESRLLEERAELIEVLSEIDEKFRDRLDSDDGSLTNYPLHMADEGTDTMEREKEALLAHQEGRQLIEVDESLRRLREDPEGFGTCDECGGEISMDRLEVVPSAKTCVDCQRRAEGAAGSTAP